MIPDEADIDHAYSILRRNGAVMLNGSLEGLWCDRPRTVSTKRCQQVTEQFSSCIEGTAFMRSDGFAPPDGLRFYAVHDVVMNCCCSRRPWGGAEIILFSGVVFVPVMRFALQLMIGRLAGRSPPPSSIGRFPDLEILAECALGYTIWQLVESTPLPLGAIFDKLCAEDRNRVTVTLASIVTFLFMHEIAHLRLNHVDIQSEIIMLAAGGGLTGIQTQHEYEADEFAISNLNPAYRGAVLTSARVLFEIVADLETLGLRFDPAHPQVVDRIGRLLDRFSHDLDEQQHALLSSFVEDRRALAASSASALPPRMRFAPVGGGATRPVTFHDADRVINLPSKEICREAVDDLITAYASR